MSKEQAEDLMKETDHIYPPEDMRDALRNYYKKYDIKEVTEWGGEGRFTRKEIKAGDLVGIYAGRKVDKRGEYVMEIGGMMVDGRSAGQEEVKYCDDQGTDTLSTKGHFSNTTAKGAELTTSDDPLFCMGRIND